MPYTQPYGGFDKSQGRRPLCPNKGVTPISVVDNLARWAWEKDSAGAGEGD